MTKLAPDKDWKVPGRGEWVRLADHFDRPWTAEYERVFRPAFEFGAAGYLLDYGLPVRSINVETVHGYPYLHPVPLVGPDTSPRGTGVAALDARAVLPAMRRCERNATRTLEARPWRARAAQWWSEDRPRAVHANRAVTAIEPETLDDHELARHLESRRAARRRRLPPALRATRHRHVPDRPVPRDVPRPGHRCCRCPRPGRQRECARTRPAPRAGRSRPVHHQRVRHRPAPPVRTAARDRRRRHRDARPRPRGSVDAPNRVDEAVPVADRERFDIRLADAPRRVPRARRQRRSRRCVAHGPVATRVPRRGRAARVERSHRARRPRAGGDRARSRRDARRH